MNDSGQAPAAAHDVRLSLDTSELVAALALLQQLGAQGLIPLSMPYPDIIDVVTVGTAEGDFTVRLKASRRLLEFLADAKCNQVGSYPGPIVSVVEVISTNVA